MDASFVVVVGSARNRQFVQKRKRRKEQKGKRSKERDDRGPAKYTLARMITTTITEVVQMNDMVGVNKDLGDISIESVDISSEAEELLVVATKVEEDYGMEVEKDIVVELSDDGFEKGMVVLVENDRMGVEVKKEEDERPGQMKPVKVNNGSGVKSRALKSEKLKENEKIDKLSKKAEKTEKISRKTEKMSKLKKIYAKKSDLATVLPCPEEGCDKVFTFRRSLSKHLANIHGKGRTYDCLEPGCGRHYDSLQRLLEHRRSQHGEAKLSCKEPGCDSEFATNNGLTWHMMKAHGKME